MYKIQLMFPQGGSKLTSTGILPPIGIISLATYLKNKIPEIDIQILDGELLGNDFLKASLEGDFLGLSVTGANYLNALNIARKAKEKSMHVILGGPHATIKHKQILSNQKCVDAVIRRDGERALTEYITAFSQNQSFLDIKNLSYKFDNQIFSNQLEKECEQINLNDLYAPNYNLLNQDLVKYNKNFQDHIYRKKGFTKFIGMESQKGCPKSNAKNKGRCTFCARIDKGLRKLNAKEFWERVEKIYDEQGKTMVWDFADSFTGASLGEHSWLEEVMSKKPHNLEGKVYFKIFARADELHIKNVEYIHKIGVREVFMGAESGDQSKLDAVNKGSTIEDNLIAVKNLKDFGIQTYVSFIYGFPGEDSRSLTKTLFHSEELIKNGDIEGIGARCLFPLAGMPVHTSLLKEMSRQGDKNLAYKIKNSDGENACELQKLWLRYMTNTSLEEIKNIHQKMIKVAQKYHVRINNEKRLLLI